MYLYGDRKLVCLHSLWTGTPSTKENIIYAVARIEIINNCNAVVTPCNLRKAASYEPRIAIFGIWGDTWLTRGKCGIYVVVCGSYGALTGST